MTTLSNLANQIVTTDSKLTDADTKITSVQATVGALKNDPRTVITTVPTTISSSGSYILGANLTATTGTAITISASNVSLDLNGYTINSTASPATGVGILINGANRRNIRIANGNIAGTTTYSGSSFTAGGFTSGIVSSSITNLGILVTGVRVSGVAQDGIMLGLSDTASLVVENCIVTICGASGITADTARRCNSNLCGGTAIKTGGIVSECEAESVGIGITHHGIVGNIVSNSIGIAINGIGISSDMVHHSTGKSSTEHGISAQEVSGSRGTSASGIGIYALGPVANSTGTSVSSTGIYGNQSVSNSTGTSSSGPFGLRAGGSASFSVGQRNGGVAIQAESAIACSVIGSGTVTSDKKFLGTP